MQQTGVISHNVPLIVRFLAKFVLDILPAALASVIGGFLFTQYQFGHTAEPHQATEQVTPASAEMMRLVRDEHAMIVDYLKAQMAAEKSKLAAQDREDARAAADAKAEEAKVADAKLADAKAAAARRLAAVGPSKPAAARNRAPINVAAMTVQRTPRAPLVIAQAAPPIESAPVAETPRDPDSLVAKTLDLKDHVVAATRRVVSAIGDIPTWIATMGDRIGNPNAESSTGSRMFSTSS
jgi:hypothetical protein